jgi:antitoxin component YwqK of YwqJK toxin-antitoxin module
MMQGTMKDGKKEGDWVVYYFNGEKSLYSSGVFRDGKWVVPSKN